MIKVTREHTKMHGTIEEITSEMVFAIKAYLDIATENFGEEIALKTLAVIGRMAVADADEFDAIIDAEIERLAKDV